VDGIGKFLRSKTLLLALGANVPGRWGSPHASLCRAIRELEHAGIAVLGASKFYVTEPLGGAPQPRYLNAVLAAEAGMAPGMLLRLLKRMERRAGRDGLSATGNRPLDLDILDYGGRRMGSPHRRRQRGRLILPHPEMHVRAFVLVPLLEIAPFWRHPISGHSAKALLAQLTPETRAGVRQALDSAVNTCDNHKS
jgi:2-amino-4-hydroxy-6-hydroxymethyldihydropteridine diphosphokinase